MQKFCWRLDWALASAAFTTYLLERNSSILYSLYSLIRDCGLNISFVRGKIAAYVTASFSANTTPEPYSFATDIRLCLSNYRVKIVSE